MIDKIEKFIEVNMPVAMAFFLKVAIAIVGFIVGIKIIGLVIKFLRKTMEKAGVDAGVTQFACSLSKIVLYLILGFSIATQFGITETSVAALLGTSGVTLGLALQGGLANLTGGVMILIFKPYVVGDYIIVGDPASGIEGKILKIEMFYTTLATMDNKTVVVPNGTLSNSCVSNVTAKDNRKLELKVGISYESDIRKAKEIIERLLHEDSDIISTEELVVFVDSLGDSSVIIGFRAWVPTDKYWITRWRLNESIKLAFDKGGIVIPYPQMDVHINQRNQRL